MAEVKALYLRLLSEKNLGQLTSWRMPHLSIHNKQVLLPAPRSMDNTATLCLLRRTYVSLIMPVHKISKILGQNAVAI